MRLELFRKAARVLQEDTRMKRISEKKTCDDAIVAEDLIGEMNATLSTQKRKR